MGSPLLALINFDQLNGEILLCIVMGFIIATITSYIIKRTGGVISTPFLVGIGFFGGVLLFSLLQIRVIPLKPAGVIIWAIIGSLVGSVSASFVTGRKEGFGFATNISMGMLGAIFGGLLFTLLGLFSDLGHLEISIKDLIASIVGAIILMFLILYAESKLFPKE